MTPYLVDKLILAKLISKLHKNGTCFFHKMANYTKQVQNGTKGFENGTKHRQNGTKSCKFAQNLNKIAQNKLSTKKIPTKPEKGASPPLD
ncbi:MAG: hypothetical protein K6T88_21185 [Bacillus sp. (in: Bacteria)]|nr:hypothetical protein [Bacillus sp. (in: firmicutes)]